MTVHSILELGNPLLRQPSAPVAEPMAPEVERIFGHMRETLAAYRDRTGYGRAITAPMIGYQQRLLYVKTEETELELVNPALISWSREEDLRYESCYSFAGLWGLVQRPLSIVIESWDLQGAHFTLDISGTLARIVQHEIDHLDGLMWIDRIPDLDSLCTTSEYEKRYTSRD